MWIEPIYDRTRADVDLIRLDPTNINTKGAYNYTDLNRVEQCCDYLMNYINECGFFKKRVHMTVKTDWNMQDIPTIDEINRIRNNVLKLQDSMFAINEFENIEFSNTMDYKKANIIEKDLYLIKTTLEKVKQDVRYCGTFSCGCSEIEW